MRYKNITITLHTMLNKDQFTKKGICTFSMRMPFDYLTSNKMLIFWNISLHIGNNKQLYSFKLSLKKLLHILMMYHR